MPSPGFTHSGNGGAFGADMSLPFNHRPEPRRRLSERLFIKPASPVRGQLFIHFRVKVKADSDMTV